MAMMVLFASAYGSGSYSTSTYSGAAGVTIGPVTLPVTGAQFLAIAGALLIGAAAGIVVWVWQRRRGGGNSV
jgi:LPXTG-motif cell wall-anchored protein